MNFQPWHGAAAGVALCVLGALVAPSSWWGVGMVMAYGAMVVLAKGVPPAGGSSAWAAYSVLLVTLLAGTYAFLVEPFGPDPVVALVCAGLFATAVGAAAMS